MQLRYRGATYHVDPAYAQSTYGESNYIEAIGTYRGLRFPIHSFRRPQQTFLRMKLNFMGTSYAR
ncbi:DUF4278 domain-containing protein [Egbenema bharatensis]|uniref:DUF4278 domain-containing protein n=1 Tax=Egbenema bharatensis TaxID=3463334 RepID=UPI003A85AB39